MVSFESIEAAEDGSGRLGIIQADGQIV